MEIFLGLPTFKNLDRLKIILIFLLGSFNPIFGQDAVISLNLIDSNKVFNSENIHELIYSKEVGLNIYGDFMLEKSITMKVPFLKLEILNKSGLSLDFKSPWFPPFLYLEYWDFIRSGGPTKEESLYSKYWVTGEELEGVFNKAISKNGSKSEDIDFDIFGVESAQEFFTNNYGVRVISRFFGKYWFSHYGVTLLHQTIDRKFEQYIIEPGHKMTIYFDLSPFLLAENEKIRFHISKEQAASFFQPKNLAIQVNNSNPVLNLGAYIR